MKVGDQLREIVSQVKNSSDPKIYERCKEKFENTITPRLLDVAQKGKSEVIFFASNPYDSQIYLTLDVHYDYYEKITKEQGLTIDRGVDSPDLYRGDPASSWISIRW